MTLKTCSWCDIELDREERKHPRRSTDGDAICDECYRDEYKADCGRCNELFDKTELEPRPCKLIGVWRDAPALGGEITAGYYRVTHWPLYADGMIEGYFFPDSLERVADLDDAGKRAAEHEQAMAGPMCDECQKAVEPKEPQ